MKRMFDERCMSQDIILKMVAPCMLFVINFVKYV